MTHTVCPSRPRLRTVALITFVAVAIFVAAATVPLAAQASTDESVSQVDVRDLLDRFFGRGGDPDQASDDDEDNGDTNPAGDEDGTRVFLFPTFGGNPAIGFAIGGLANLTTYWGEPSTTPLSSMIVSAAFTTKSQLLLVARSDLYAPDDGWHLAGDWRFYKFVERTHGFGSNSPVSTFADVDYDWLRLHQTVYRPVWAGLEVGIGYHLDIHDNISFHDDKPEQLSNTVDPVEFESTTSSGVSANLVFDRRDNPLNPSRGVLGRATYTFFRESLGGSSDWENLQLEGRAYHRLPGGRQHRLAFWSLGWLTRGSEAPYFDLPSVGWDTYGRTSRGYRAGRFRGRDWIYSELEYRTDVTRNGLIGAVAFVNVSTFSDTDKNFGRWVVGGGAGARFKLDKDRRSNIGVDVGFGREGSVGVFLALNEAF